MRHLFASSIIAVGLFIQPVLAQKLQPIVIGHGGVIRSEIMGENRPIQVSLPDGYEQSNQKYPVLYLLDGPGHLHHTVGTAKFLARNGQMPQVIIVAIANTANNRTRDLTPPTTVQGGQGATGGAEKMLDFMNDELFPFVEKQFRTQPYRILVGHSFGGLFAVNAMIYRPEMFNAYVAISPSLWWDNQRLLKETEFLFQENESFNKSLYLTLGNERDQMRVAFEGYIDIVEREAPDDFSFGHMLLEDETHGSVPLRSTIHGLRKIYEDWAMPRELFTTADIESMKAFSNKLTKKFGYEIKMPEARVNQLGYQVLGRGQIDKAIEIFAWNVEEYPESANVYDSLGEAYEAKGEFDEALKLFTKAVTRGKAINDPNTNAYQQHANRVLGRIGNAM